MKMAHTVTREIAKSTHLTRLVRTHANAHRENDASLCQQPTSLTLFSAPRTIRWHHLTPVTLSLAAAALAPLAAPKDARPPSSSPSLTERRAAAQAAPRGQMPTPRAVS